MKLQARVQLNLPKTYNIINLTYHTYEKATFDKYLAASIVLRSKNKAEIEKYIDDITGKGSLNEHFKKLVNNILELDEESIKKILDNSMYPITKIDKSNRYTYYPYFNISIYTGKIFSGNLGELSISELKEILLLEVDLINFSIESKDETRTTDNYNILFNDREMKIGLTDKHFENITIEQFIESYKRPIIDIGKYQGIVYKSAEGENWKMLTEASFNSIVSSNRIFFDDSRNSCSLTNDYIKKTELAYVFGLYFYREEKIDFIRKNEIYCKSALRSLFDNSLINEVKTQTLIKLLKAVDDLSAQETINFILTRKESKDISQFGLELIRKGVKNDWNVATLKRMKKFATRSDINLIYQINNNVDFTNSELIIIDDVLLTQSDLARKQNYLSEKNNKLVEIKRILGEISGSSLREKVKKVLPQNSNEVKKFTKLCNKLLAHSKTSLDELSDEQLNNRYNEFLEFNENYLAVKKMYEEKVNK